MKRWKSHKQVEAGIIAELGSGRVLVESPGAPGSADPPAPVGHEWVDVPDDIFARGTPIEGVDWLVRYADGYISWSPAAAFEEGYDAVE
jgi:hypothetical protein